MPIDLWTTMASMTYAVCGTNASSRRDDRLLSAEFLSAWRSKG
jgi:hypothetical protein